MLRTYSKIIIIREFKNIILKNYYQLIIEIDGISKAPFGYNDQKGAFKKVG
jgi:hypothetical protein